MKSSSPLALTAFALLIGAALAPFPWSEPIDKAALQKQLEALPEQQSSLQTNLAPKLEGSTVDMIDAFTQLSDSLMPTAISLVAASQAITPQEAEKQITRDLEAITRHLQYQMNFDGSGGTSVGPAIASARLAHLRYLIIFKVREVFANTKDFPLEKWTETWANQCGMYEGC
jgi:hypothetical protein